MDFIITAIAFIVIFSVLVLIHEWGHFFAARKAGVKVEEFGFGLPPRIWGKKFGETLYSVNWIPFGGFVKLLGEDAHDPRVAASKGSYAGKKPWVRLIIVTAGVLMNFVLAFVLLTIGFTFGIQPLIVETNDVFVNLENGNIQIAPGILVKDVKEDSVAFKAGLKAYDRIVSINGEDIFDLQQIDLDEVPGGHSDYVYSIIRDGETLNLSLPVTAGEALGFDLYQVFFIPHPVLGRVIGGSAFDYAGLKQGDTIVSVNGKGVYFLDDVVLYQNEGDITIGALRGGETLLFHVVNAAPNDSEVISKVGELPLDDTGFVVIDQIFKGAPAQQAGLKNGDIMMEINGERVNSAEQFVDLTHSNAGKDTLFKIRRGEQVFDFTIRPTDQGLIGVGLPKVKVLADSSLVLYASSAPVSVLSIKDVQYPFWFAPIKALEETGRLSVMTFSMFGDVVSSIFTRFTVPEGVAGPIGIARLTYTFVQEGFLSVLRFMALLSLSLGIINIFPFPALDGGRAFFILLEIIFKKPISLKFEAIVHGIGFLILMGIIFFITYNDILNFF